MKNQWVTALLSCSVNFLKKNSLIHTSYFLPIPIYCKLLSDIKENSPNHLIFDDGNFKIIANMLTVQSNIKLFNNKSDDINDILSYLITLVPINIMPEFPYQPSELDEYKINPNDMIILQQKQMEIIIENNLLEYQAQIINQLTTNAKNDKTNKATIILEDILTKLFLSDTFFKFIGDIKNTTILHEFEERCSINILDYIYNYQSNKEKV
ncbi:hypothetical protein L3V82_12260 [Thiotrichales bacterium 19S3-7]|nr:hypothetical protein [Thiotrichales bacterium 19S3-7]MCF6802963.1 hypothetical protein [Thiotrichales bacterium 19S3-11]